MMHSYAQTNLQLFHQLQCKGYSKEDLILIRDTYDLAMRVFTGRYRPSGKTFISHVVGTASILASLQAPIKLVAAGLIHSIYTEADFGIWAKGISTAKREQVRTVVGEEAEEYVYRYAVLEWNIQNIIAIRERFDRLASIDRDVLLIRLADQREDNLDLGILHCSYINQGKSYIQSMGSIMVEMAAKLSFLTLAAELEKAFRKTVSAEIPEELRKPSRGDISFLIPPQSYHRKLSVVLEQTLNRKINDFLGFIRRIIRKFHSLFLFKKSPNSI